LPHRLRLDPSQEITPLERIEQVLEKVRERDETTPEEPDEKVEIKKN
jgi:hypothetical protein